MPRRPPPVRIGDVRIADELLEAIEHEVYIHLRDCLDLRAHDRAKEQRPNLIETFAEDYARCIEAAVCQYAYLLARALIARGKPISSSRREAILEQAITFSDFHAMWPDFANYYLAVAMGVELNIDYEDKIPPDSRTLFIESVEEWRNHWITEVLNKIRLCQLIYGGRSRPATQPDRTKVLIASIKGRYPRISQLRICSKLDAYNDKTENSAPLPPSWQSTSVGTWCHALKNPQLKTKVKTYLSKIKPLRSARQFSGRTRFPELPTESA